MSIVEEVVTKGGILTNDCFASIDLGSFFNSTMLLTNEGLDIADTVKGISKDSTKLFGRFQNAKNSKKSMRISLSLKLWEHVQISLNLQVPSINI